MHSSRIDNVVGSRPISEHFAATYKQLYNKVENGEKLQQLDHKISQEIDNNSLLDLKRIDNRLIRNALNKMKSNKRDALYNIASDCFIEGPEELISHLTNLIRTYLIHGSVPKFLLVCSLFPLVKNKFGDNFER